MATGGTLWFPDLMAGDTTMFLPTISCLSWLAVVEVRCYIVCPYL
jgi:hypothetical protein